MIHQFGEFFKACDTGDSHPKKAERHTATKSLGISCVPLNVNAVKNQTVFISCNHDLTELSNYNCFRYEMKFTLSVTVFYQVICL